MHATRFLSCFLATLVFSGCALGPDDPSEVDDGIAVPQGKEDDFYSLSAYEYRVAGQSTVVLEPEMAEAEPAAKLERVEQLIGYKQIAIAWFLTQYLVEKEDEDPNAAFGGFGGMAKNGQFEDLDVVQLDELTYQFTFRQVIAGKENLMSALPITVNEEGKTEFSLTIGKPSNAEMARLETNREWYRSSPWDGWNPETASDDQKEELTLAIEREIASTDAWFDYQGLFEDGKLTIDVHMGWDYHNDYHVKHARALFSWLVNRKGFEPPVATFDELDRTSGAFTKTINANGRDIDVEVRIFYGKTGTDTDPDTDAGGQVLEDDMRVSLSSRDAIVYSGHSGPFYGFALANWRVTEEGDLDDSEMSSVNMPRDKYQIIFAEGCDTYQIGQAFRENPAKPGGAFVDVITTTQSSNASTPDAVEDFISRLIELDSQSRHRPRTMKSLLYDLDSNSFWYHTMYGIHGIDDNPALHPYAELDNLCASCSENRDCGGVGNMCVGVGSDGKHCVAACTDDRGCPDGYACTAIASSSAGTIYARACVPESFTCTE